MGPSLRDYPGRQGISSFVDLLPSEKGVWPLGLGFEPALCLFRRAPRWGWTEFKHIRGLQDALWEKCFKRLYGGNWVEYVEIVDLR